MKIALFSILVHRQLDNDEAIEQIDEDIAVTQSQMNFICPITQVCYHYYNNYWEIAVSYSSLICFVRNQQCL